MNDHVRPTSRIATQKAVVVIEQPNWTTELLSLLAVLLLVAWMVAEAQLIVTREERDEARERGAFWTELALAEDTAANVRLVNDGAGFRCSHWQVRREWERAITTKCQELGSLLVQARTTP